MEERSLNEQNNLRPRFRLGFNQAGPITTSSIASVCRRMAVRHITILQWLPKYSKEDGICDFIAGISLGLTMLPQSIAYAILAGLSPQYGLYSSFVGVLAYVVLGTVKEVSIGVTSMLALLTLEFTQDLSVDFVILLTFLSGCVELLFGVLHLGVLVDFISEPVVSSFTTATSIITVGAQLKGLLGIKYKSAGFLDNIWKIFSNIQNTKIEDAALGISSIAFLLIFRKLKDIPIGRPKNTSNVPDIQGEREGQTRDSNATNGTLKRSLWFLSIGRNAMIVIIGAILAFTFENKWGKAPFALSGQINPGFPPVQPPPFSTTYGNKTYNFGEMVTELRSGIIIVPVVSVLSNVAIAKIYSTGENMHATQEMVTLGLCNVIGSFVSSMPMCAGFSRSVVSSASGVRTPLAGLYTGLLILLALGFLTPYFYYIPRATLSAVLISAVIFMADFKIFKTLWKTSKRDLLAALATFMVCLGVGIEIGLLLGVAINCSFLLYLWARPGIHVEHKRVHSHHEYLLVTPDAGLYFPSIEFVRMEVGRIGVRESGGVLPVVLNCSHLKGLDYSAAKGIIQILREFKNRQQPIALLKLREEFFVLLKEFKVGELIHCSCEEDLEAALFDDFLDAGNDIMSEIENKSTEVRQPLLEQQLTKEQASGSTDKTLAINDNKQ